MPQIRRIENMKIMKKETAAPISPLKKIMLADKKEEVNLSHRTCCCCVF